MCYFNKNFSKFRLTDEKRAKINKNVDNDKRSRPLHFNNEKAICLLK